MTAMSDAIGYTQFVLIALITLISIVIQFVVKEKRSVSRTVVAPAANATNDGANLEAAAAPPPKTAAKLHYLSNIKAFLTAIVVIHHSGSGVSGDDWMGPVLGSYDSWAQRLIGAHLGNDQGYFMALFFFISAYFTPTSFERKGPALFFKEKLRRIGWPLCFFALVLGPLLCVGMKSWKWLNIDVAIWHFWPSPGPCWYLFWLLTFSAGYAVVYPCAPTITCGLPNLFVILLVGAVGGALQTAILEWTMDSVWGGAFYMKWGYFPMYLVMWIAGVLARRNKWLDDISDLSTSTIYAYIILSVIFMAGYYVIAQLAEDFGAAYRSYQVVFGMLCVTMSISQIHVFHRYFNTDGAVARFFGDAAYAVYLIHPWIVTPLQQSYIEILRAHGEEIVFPKNELRSHSELSSPWLLILGWVYTAVLASLIVWPLAWCLKQAPILRDII